MGLVEFEEGKRVLSVEQVVESFVKNALVLGGLHLTCSDFSDRLYHSVSNETGLDLRDVVKLHHPIWWELISFNGDLTPLHYSPSLERGGEAKISLNGEVGDYSIIQLMKEILDKHGKLYEARFERLGLGF